MIRKNIHTICLIVFTVIFNVISIFVINKMFAVCGGQVLNMSGLEIIEPSVKEWDKKGSEIIDESVNSTDIGAKNKKLSMKQIEDAVKSWNNRISVVLHEPVSGQIVMEDAIKNGKKWLLEMGVGDTGDEASYSISAELGVGRMIEDNAKKEAYYSFWTVTYSNQSINVVLYINAVTGKVWGADIKQYVKQQEIISDDRLEDFVRLAGLKLDDEAQCISEPDGIKTIIMIKNSRLYAQGVTYYMGNSAEDYYECVEYKLQ